MALKRKALATALLVSLSPLSVAGDLMEVYQRALENDPTLRAAQATYRANLEQENISFSSLLPQVNASANYTMTDRELDADSGITQSQSDSYGWSVSASQTVFDANRWFNFQSAKFTTESAEAQFAADQQDLIVRVVQAYLDVLRAVSDLETSKAEETALTRQYEQTQQRYDVGLIAITDVYEARSTLDGVIANRIQLEGQVAIKFEALEAITGQPESSVVPLMTEVPIAQPVPSSPTPWVAASLENNLDLRVSLAQLNAAEQTASATNWNRGPKATLSADYGQSTSEVELPQISNSDSDGWTATLRVSMPLFAGGGLSASSRRAHEQFNVAKERHVGTQRAVTQRARSSYLSATTGVATVDARQQAIISAQSSLDATQAGYEVGTRNIVDVLNAQQALFRAQSNFSNARFDYIISLLVLKQVAGSLSPEDIQRLNDWLDPENELNRVDLSSY
jgi:outer membrane protein